MPDLDRRLAALRDAGASPLPPVDDVRSLGDRRRRHQRVLVSVAGAATACLVVVAGAAAVGPTAAPERLTPLAPTAPTATTPSPVASAEPGPVGPSPSTAPESPGPSEPPTSAPALDAPSGLVTDLAGAGPAFVDLVERYVGGTNTGDLDLAWAALAPVLQQSTTRAAFDEEKGTTTYEDVQLLESSDAGDTQSVVATFRTYRASCSQWTVTWTAYPGPEGLLLESEVPMPGSPSACAPLAPAPGWPLPARISHGDQVYGVYLDVTTGGEPPSDEVVAQAEAAGYEVGAGDIGCDQGAAEALGLDPDQGYLAASVYFLTAADAQLFVDLYEPGVVGTAFVTLYCLD